MRVVDVFFVVVVVCTDISSEHSLHTCTQVRRNVRKSNMVYACQKRKKTDESDCDQHMTGIPGAFFARGPPMCSPFLLGRRDHLISWSFFFFVNVVHF